MSSLQLKCALDAIFLEWEADILACPASRLLLLHRCIHTHFVLPVLFVCARMWNPPSLTTCNTRHALWPLSFARVSRLPCARDASAARLNVPLSGHPIQVSKVLRLVASSIHSQLPSMVSVNVYIVDDSGIAT